MAAPEAKADIWSWIETALEVPLSCGVSVSVWPEYAEAIAAGTKQVELRRTRITSPVSHMAFYATAPEKRLACVCDAFGLNGTMRRLSGRGGATRAALAVMYSTPISTAAKRGWRSRCPSRARSRRARLLWIWASLLSA